MNASSDSTRKKPEFSHDDLIFQLQLKNDEAFNYLYNAYSHSILLSIKKIIKCEVIVEDILQNVFIKIWLNINKYSEIKGGLFAWMISIARHEAIDYVRSKQAKVSSRTSCLELKESESPTLMQPELIRFDLLRSLKFITGKERMIILLYNRGFTCREIGKLLELPVGTVKTKMRMSFRKLRAIHAR